MERKLTAILSADVKGYSRLMGEDEEATIRTLTAYRDLISTLIQQHRGRVVDSPGDNVLAEFASVVDAVRCAVEIQQALKEKNVELSAQRQMEFRLGLNLGDVVMEGDRIYGDGVNIAARLESMAEPGSLCLSGTVYDQIENKLPLTYEYLGEQPVKNITKPVRVYRGAGNTGRYTTGCRRSLSSQNRGATLVGYGPDSRSYPAVLMASNLKPLSRGRRKEPWKEGALRCDCALPFYWRPVLCSRDLLGAWR